jgi:hypothetical protein
VGALIAGHARQVHVLDHFQSQLEQFDADAKCLEPEIGRLDQHHQIGWRHAPERGQHNVGTDAVEIDELRLVQIAAVAFGQRACEVRARVVHHQRLVRGTMFDDGGQDIAKVRGRGVDGAGGNGAPGGIGRRVGSRGDRHGVPIIR